MSDFNPLDLAAGIFRMLRFGLARSKIISERIRLKKELVKTTDHVREFDLCRAIQKNCSEEAALINGFTTQGTK